MDGGLVSWGGRQGVFQAVPFGDLNDEKELTRRAVGGALPVEGLRSGKVSDREEKRL